MVLITEAIGVKPRDPPWMDCPVQVEKVCESLRLTSLTVEDIFGSTENRSIRILLDSILKSHQGLSQRVKIVTQLTQLKFRLEFGILKVGITIVVPTSQGKNFGFVDAYGSTNL